MGQKHKSDKEKLFDTQLGQQVKVHRETVKGDDVRIRNQMLSDIGESSNPIPKHLTYKGSAAVHIYYNETLKQAFFVSQVGTLGDCPELLAQAATKDFLGTIMEFFGQRRPKLRSGF